MVDFEKAVWGALRQCLPEVSVRGCWFHWAFMEMKARCPHDASLQKLLQYMLKTWITSSSRPPASWTTFKRSVRTNNDPEGWHSRLNHNATHDHLNLYLLMQTLHQEAALLPLQVRLVAQGKLYRYQSKKTMTKQAALKELWTLYERQDRTISTPEYLRQCSNLADHVEE